MKEDQVRIFVSSPSDVEHERAAVKDIVERLAQEYLSYFMLQAVLWEEEALTADRTFQAGLTQPADCDIVLVILWTRLGSPLPEEPYRGMTGTEWEFFDAVNASKEGGKPEVLVYKKIAPKLVDITDAAAAREAVEDRRRVEEFFREHFFNEDNTFRRAFRTFDNDAAFRELLEMQLRKLLNRRISAERRAAAGPAQWQGSPFRPDRPFEIGDERVFTGREREVRDLLTRLEARAPDEPGFLLLSGPSGAGKTSLLRAGLAARLTRPFLFEQISTVRCALIDPLADGPTPIAALATRLCSPDVLGDPLAEFGLGATELERLLTTEPAVAGRQLASALAQLAKGNDSGAAARLAVIVDPLEGALDAHGEPQLTAFAHALRRLADNPVIWIMIAVRSDALYRLAQVPALSEVLTAERWTELEPPATERIRQVVEIPARIAGIEIESADDAQGRGLLEQIEAEASRLRLWAPPVQGVLDAAYQDARQAASQPRPDRSADSAADDRRTGELRLSAEHFQRQGGLGGHMLSRADALWAELDDAARAALPRLCRALLGSDSGVGSRTVIRRGDLRVLGSDAGCRRLLDAMIAARLVIAEGVYDPSIQVHCEAPDYRLLSAIRGAWRQGRRGLTWPRRARQSPSATAADDAPGIGRSAIAARASVPEEAAAASADAPINGHPDAAPEVDADAGADSAQIDLRAYRPVASLSHPALISNWAPIRDWVRNPDNQRLLHLRGQLSRQALLWKRTDCNSEYLYRELSFAAVQLFANRFANELEPLEREFLQRSRAHIGFVRRRNRFVRGVGLVLLALVVAATAAAGFALHASQDARVNLHRSKLKEADLHISRGNTPQAVIQAIDAGQDLPEKAVQTLSLAFSGNRLMAMARSAGPEPGQPRIPGFNADGTLLTTLTPDHGPRLWRLQNGRFIADRDLQADGLMLHSLFIGDDDQIFGIGEAGIWRLPASAGAPPLYPCGSVPGAMFRLDAGRRYLAIARSRDATAGDPDQGVCVVDLALPGKVLLDLPLAEGQIRGLSFSPDAERLLTASALGRTHLIDLNSGETLLSLPEEGPLGRPFNNAVFDSDGERIAIAAVDERVRLYRTDGSPIDELADSDIGGERFKIHRTAVRDVAFAPGGAFLVAVDDEGQVVRWSLDGSRQAVVLGNHLLSISDLEIAPAPAAELSDETLVLTGSLDMTARLWGLETGKQVAVLGHDGALSAVSFSRSGERVFTFSERDGTVRLWSIDPVSRLAFKLAHPDHVWNLDMASAPDELAPNGSGLLLATAGFDGGVRVWRYDRSLDQASPQLLASFQNHHGRVRQVRFSADGRLLASAGYDGTAQLHDLVTEKSCALTVKSEAAGNQVTNALFGPHGDWLLTTSNDPLRPVRMFSTQRCLPIDTGTALDHAGAEVDAAAIQAGDGGTLLATGDQNGVLRVFSHDTGGSDADGWQRRCELDLEIGAIGDLAWSSDGHLLGVAGTDSRAALVSVGSDGDTGCRLGSYLEGHTGRVYSIAIAPDAGQVLTASLDKTARVWGRDGTQRAVLIGHQDRIYRAGFSPDGTWMLTASRDGSIRLWQTPAAGRRASDIERLSAFLPLRADLGGVANAMFSPDGHYIAGAYWENAALLWRIWSEDDAVPEQRTKRWGRERARLALVGEAYRFRADNQVVDQDALLEAESLPGSP
jgi:WD40 repeat protein